MNLIQIQIIFIIFFIIFSVSFCEEENYNYLLQLEKENNLYTSSILNDTIFISNINSVISKNQEKPDFLLHSLLDIKDTQVTVVSNNDILTHLPSLSSSPYVTFLFIHSSKCPTCIAFNPTWKQITRLPYLDFFEFDIEQEEVSKTLNDLNFLKYGAPTILVLSHHNTKPKVLYSYGNE